MNEFEALGFLYSRVKVNPSDYSEYCEAMKIMTELVSKATEKINVNMREGEAE
jgi:hypothetical protein